MKKIYTLIIATIIFFSANAQNPTFTWAKAMGGTNAERGQGICTDASGNVLSTGLFSGTADFDPGVGIVNMTSAGGNDLYISKLDASGNFVWAKRVGGTGSEQGTSITTDLAGNVYITGMFNGTAVDFDPGAGTFTMTAIGDAFILKLDPAGNFIFAKQFITSSGGGQAYSIGLDPSGNIYTTGGFALTTDFDPGPGTFTIMAPGGTTAVYVSKLNASGNFIWAKSLGGTSTSSNGRSLIIDAANNVYLTGEFDLTSDFDPGAGTFNLTSIGSSDIFISKLDINGNFVWAKQIGSVNQDQPYGITLDANNNVYSTGFFWGVTDFDPGVGVYTLTPLGSRDAYINKLDASGNFVWAKQFGGSGSGTIGYSIYADANSNIYTVGSFGSASVDFDPNIGVFNLTSFGGNDAFISKLNSSGNFLWAGQMGGTGNGDVGYSVFVDVNRSIYVTGAYVGTADFDAGVGTSTIISVGVADIFVTKYCQSPEQASVVSGSLSICAGSSPIYSLSPLPGATTYTWVLPGGWSGAGTSNTINPATGASGTISVSGVNGCGTGLSQTIVVTVNPLPTITVNSGSICSGNSFTMVPSGASTYTFQGGNAVVSPITNTSYTVAGTSTAGCVSASTATSNVTVSATPTVVVNSGSICNGQSFTMTPSGASTYTFSTGPVVSPTTTSSYSVTGTSTAGCVSASAAISNVTVNALPVIAVNSGSICNGQNFTMVPSGASTYTFQGGNAVVSPTTNTSYTVTGTSTAGCVSSSFATSNVTVNALPSISVNSGSICSGNSFTMIPSGANTYTFQGGSAIVSPTSNASYTITGTSAQGCVSTLAATSNVTVAPSPTISASTNNTLICVGQSATLTASGASTYTWNPGGAGTNITVSPTVTANYTITGTSAQGCNNSFVFTQNVSTCAGINQITNSASELNVYPNPFNNVITITGVINETVSVYNILGELVHTELPTAPDNCQLDLTIHPSGIYFIRIGSATKKIIKQ